MPAIRTATYFLSAAILIALIDFGAAQVPANPPEAALTENAYDFNNPDSIPGFGTLPPDYDAAAVMPLTSDGF